MTGTGTGVILLAAGGTGGHLFPAQALAEELVGRGYTVHLATDERVRDYGKAFPAAATHIIPSATLSLSKPFGLPLQAWKLRKGYKAAQKLLSEVLPMAVVGFGGYPPLPPVLAAARMKIPTAIHDQNAVMGRANRLLSRFVDAVASSFPDMSRLPPAAKAKLVHTGNPVRRIVLDQKAAPYPPLAADTPFRVLVFGGSQGARFFAEFMPKVVAELPQAVLKTLHITQQCRPEDIEGVRAAYKAKEVSSELASFFFDMPRRIADAHLVICRSGASSIAELGVIGRPAVMVPLPHALDNDQLKNAESLAAAGAGWVRPQADLNARDLAAFLTRLRYQEAELQQAARAALGHGIPDAAKRLADLTERLAKRSTEIRT